jgi:hypothetical protein
VDVGAPPESLGVSAANAVLAGIAAKALGRLLGIKNHAEYGLTTISRANRELAMRQARRLVKFAETALER